MTKEKKDNNCIIRDVEHDNSDEISIDDREAAKPLPIPVVDPETLKKLEKESDSDENLKERDDYNTSNEIIISEPTFVDLKTLAQPVPGNIKYTHPYFCVGKLRMQAPNGSWFVASGVLVAPDLVLTAGHCVYDKSAGGYYKNMLFRPMHPLGSNERKANNIAVRDEWVIHGNYAHDYAFIKLRFPFMLGNIGLVVNGDLSATRVSVGYPAEPPFDGDTLFHATGQTFYRLENWYGMRNNDMTGGSSGGPWLDKNNITYAYGLNSFKRPDRLNVMYSPIFGEKFKELHDTIS